MFRRILLVVSVAAITATMMVLSAVPAFAQEFFLFLLNRAKKGT